MKSYTDLEQSKTLAKILNEETADLWWTQMSLNQDLKNIIMSI